VSVETNTMGRNILTGTLGLLLAVVWAMAFLYQRHNVDFLLTVMSADAPAVLRLSSLWSLLQIGIPTLLVLPVAEVSVAMMFGARPLLRALRVALVTTAVLSVGVLLSNAGFAVARIADGGPALLPNPTINNELLAAVVTLGLQVALLALLRTPGNDDTHLDPQLATLPAPPVATHS